jgi:hypothetical protein
VPPPPSGLQVGPADRLDDRKVDRLDLLLGLFPVELQPIQVHPTQHALDVLDLRVAEHADALDPTRNLLGDLRSEAELEVAWRLRHEVESDEIGPGICREHGIRRVGDATDLDSNRHD